LVIFYVVFIILVIIVASISAIKSVQIYLYGALSAIGLVYLVIFPVGLSVYAIRIYCLVRDSRNNAALKMIRFLLVTNVMFALLTVMAIIGVVMTIVGWDVMGEFIGLHRTIFIDVVMIITSFMITYLTHYRANFNALYGICCTNFVSDENEQMIKPERRKHSIDNVELTEKLNVEGEEQQPEDVAPSITSDTEKMIPANEQDSSSSHFHQ